MTMAHVTSAISVLMSMATLYILVFRFKSERRAESMSAGQKDAAIVQLRHDLDSASTKIAVLEERARCSDNDITEIKTDLKHILKALERLEQRMENRHPEGT
jgi:predicted  nucleic acid-binding Zn-ribbon protein